MLPDARHFCDRRLTAPATGPPALPSFSMTSAAAGTSGLTPEQISAIDAAHLWHPYSTIGGSNAGAVRPNVVAVGAHGARLTLIRDGRPIEALDAMSSWWTAIHGHGHPALDAALAAQRAQLTLVGLHVPLEFPRIVGNHDVDRWQTEVIPFGIAASVHPHPPV